MARTSSRSGSGSSAARSRSGSSPASRGGAKGRTSNGNSHRRSSSSSASSSRSGGKGSTSSKVTTNHDEIRQWVESRGGHPACVRGTGGRGDTGLLRIDYPGFAGEDKLQEISWDEFFEQFHGQNLAFLYQERTKSGDPSRFSKLVDRSRANSKSNSSSSDGSSSRRRGSSSGGGRSATGARSRSQGKSHGRSAR